MQNRHPSNRLRDLINFFETHDIATRQQLLEVLDVNPQRHSLDNFVDSHWITHIQHNQYRLHPDVLELIHTKIPGGYLRRDKQSFVHMDEDIDIRSSLKEKIHGWAKKQNLLLEDLQIHSDNTYTLKFHPGRYNRLDNKVLFDISKGLTVDQLLNQAAKSESAGAWELGVYYRHLANHQTQFSESVLQKVMKAVFTEQDGSLRVSQISAEDFKLGITPLSQQTSTFDGFRWDDKSKTLVLDGVEGDWRQYKEKLEDALVEIKQNLRQENVFNRIASITLKRVLPVIGVGLVVADVAHAGDPIQAFTEEISSLIGGALGMAAGAAVAGVVCGPGAPLCAAGVIAGGAVFGVEAMKPFNDVFAIARVNLEEWTNFEIAEEERQRQAEEAANQYFSIGMEQFKKYCDMPSVRLETALAAIEAFNKAKELNPALPDLDRYIAVATEESNYLNNRLAEADQHFNNGINQLKKQCDTDALRLETLAAAINEFDDAKKLNPALSDLNECMTSAREERNCINKRLAEADQHFNNGINQLKKYCDTDALRLETLAAAIDEFDKARKLNPALSDINECIITAAREESNGINNRIQQQQRMQAAIQQRQRNARGMHRVPVNNTANLSALHDSFFKELEKNRAIQNQQSAALQNNLKNLNIQLPVYNPNIPNSFDTLINYEKNKTPAERGGSTGGGYGGPGLFLRPCIGRIEFANGQVSIDSQCSKKPF